MESKGNRLRRRHHKVIKMKKSLFLAVFAVSLFVASCCNNPQTKVKVFAHRGLCSSGDKFVTDENTLDALSRAQARGVDGIEFDVHLTTDSALVIRHDNKIAPGLSCQGNTLAEIREHTLPFGNKIPTLQQWLDRMEATPQIRMMLEIKAHKTPEQEALVIAKSLKEIKDRNMLDRTYFLSFSPETCDEILRQEPSAKALLNSNDLHHSLPPSEVKERGYSAVSYNVSVILNHIEWVKEFQEYGIDVFLWMVNNTYLRDLAQQLGFTGVTTDFYEVVGY